MMIDEEADIVIDNVDVDDILKDPNLQEELRLLEVEEKGHSSNNDDDDESLLNHELQNLNINDETLAVHQDYVSSSELDPEYHFEIDEDEVTRDIMKCNSIVEARKEALNCQRSGQTSLALKWFRKMKYLKEKAANNILAPSNIPVSTAKVSTVQDSFDEVEKLLMTAEQFNLNEAKRLKQSNPKEAVERMRNYKYYNQELVVLRSRKLIPGSLPPLFHWETKRIELKCENTDIGDDQIKLSIDGLHGLDPKLAGSVVTIAFHLAFGSDFNEALATGNTPAVKVEGNNAIFDFKSSYSIVKRGKASQTAFGRKKARFEVFKSSFFSKKSVGVAVISFAELLTKVETGGDIPLTEDDRSRSKKVGGVIRLHLKLRNPISAPETRVIEERILRIDSWPEPQARFNEVTTVIGLPTSTAQVSSLESLSKNVPIIELSAREKSDPLAIEHIESNDVIEYDIKRTEESLIAGMQDTDLFVTNVRLQGLRTKLMILQNKVSSGSLDLNDYLDILRNRLSRDKAIYQYLIQNGSVDADAIKMRVTIMENEIKGAEDDLS